MEMRHQKVQFDIRVTELSLDTPTQVTSAGTCVNNDDALGGAHFETGGVPPETEVARYRGWYGPANSPKFQLQS